MRPLEILVVDEPSRAELVRESLERGGIVYRASDVTSAEPFRAILEQKRFDLVVAETSLSGLDAFTTLELLQSKAPGCPVIFITNSIDEAAVELLRRGAANILSRKHLQRLPEAVRDALAEVARQTEQKRAAEHLAEQAAFLDVAQEAIVAGDLEGRIHYWSKGAERMHGWSGDEVLGRKTTDFLYRDPFWFSQAITQLLERSEWLGEVVNLTKTGTEILTETHWSLVRDSTGRPKSLLAISTDITEKKRLEAKFLRAQRLETLGTLAGGIAHDLNNVLTPLVLGIDLLRLEMTGQAHQELLQTMQASAQRAAGMVLQILAFAGGASGERAILDVKHLINEISRFVRDSFPKSIQLRTLVPPDLQKVIGNATQLHQVLLNLCVNARDAMPQGGYLQIKARNTLLEKEATPTPHVVLTVSDTGEGISPEVLNRIFEPFFTTKPRGTGLGLSTVHGIIKDHGGLVEVTSQPGQGTRFEVYLPAVNAPELEKVPARQPPLPGGRGETILVGDDEMALLELTRESLESFNYRVLLAKNGAEVVELYRAHQAEIAVVIVDMMMPKMDGPEAIRALKQMNPAVKIIGITGLNVDSDLASSARTHTETFLQKPFATAALLISLRALIEEKTV